MSREAMQMALELIEPIAHNSTDDPRGKAYEAITALRQALEQPESLDLSKFTPANQQQMREWLADGSFAQRAIDTMFSLSEEITALYTAPPKREWVGLTDEDEIPWDGVDAKSFAKAIEAKLKEKNT